MHLKSLILYCLRLRVCGYPTAWCLLRLGFVSASKRVSTLCRYVPRRVLFTLPSEFAVPRLCIQSTRGRDLVARVVWWRRWDAYEKPMGELFSALAARARHVFDIGAYSGFFSLLSAAASKSVQVHAFEPYPVVREALLANIHLNRLSDRITVCPNALSGSEHKAEFFIPSKKTNILETASSLCEGHWSSHSDIIEVNTTTIDHYVALTDGIGVDLMNMRC